jgi:hypothetical protein
MKNPFEKYNKIKSLTALIFFILFISCSTKNKEDMAINKATESATIKLNKSIIEYKNSDKNPRNLGADKKTHFVKSKDWTSGFYPGCLWYLYELTNDTAVKAAAERHTELIEDQQYNGTTHDMGFKMYCSYGNGYRLTGNEKYKEVLLQSAATLITRFNPTVGCIRSWDHNKDKWQFPVIIDNMMNLELLMWAFKETNDSAFYKIAVSHANTTMANHFREDYSSYHVIGYDTLTGKVVQKNTKQGFAHESSWARGQAWGVYGYTMLFRETNDSAYLQQAEKIAEYILSHKNMPANLVPYWDYDAPNIPNEPKDVSAAAVTSSALFELSTYSTNNSEKYKMAAEKILQSLCSPPYFAADDANHNFILEHSTGDWPKNSEIDEPIIYADYYFLESLVRRRNLMTKE